MLCSCIHDSFWFLKITAPNTNLKLKKKAFAIKLLRLVDSARILIFESVLWDGQ